MRRRTTLKRLEITSLRLGPDQEDELINSFIEAVKLEVTDVISDRQRQTPVQPAISIKIVQPRPESLLRFIINSQSAQHRMAPLTLRGLTGQYSISMNHWP